jgi:hypothetical protein
MKKLIFLRRVRKATKGSRGASRGNLNRKVQAALQNKILSAL